jgi:phospholipid/cholesterol/gamma-HCH transport system substrate-binding protein
MSNRTRDIIVGMTAIAGIAGVGFLMFLFGYIPKFLEPGYTVKVHFVQAGGLNSASRVILDGLDIGRLTKLDLQQPPKRGIVMTALIREEFNIPKDVKVTVASKLLGGSPVLAFYTKDLTDEQITHILPKDGTAYLEGQLSSMLAEVTEKLQGYLDPAINNLSKVAEDFASLSRQWTQVGANIAQMTEPRTLDDVDAGKAAANLNTLLVRADKRMAELKSTIDNINKFVGDDQLKADIKNLVKQTTTTAQAWEKTATQTQERTAAVTKKLYSVADDMSAAIQSAQKLLDTAATGKGTVGKLLNDAALYQNLNDAVNRLNGTLDEARLLIQKIKAEGVNVNL